MGSVGAVFNIVANDGKADRLIMATHVLQQRIKEIVCWREAHNEPEPEPTLSDIEKTHILFVNAHFKPFAAIAFEYHKVQSSAGNNKLGSTVIFQLPTFGDFFFDMVAYIRLSAVSAGVRTSPARDASSSVFGVDDSTEGVAYDLVDAFGKSYGVGATAGSTVTYQNLVRYCEFPANRIYEYVKFSVNGNVLDEYYSFTSAMLEKFTILPNKRAGYNRLTGQETVLTGYSGPIESEVSDPQGESGPSKLVESRFGSALNDYAREVKQIVNGPQTPKPTQPTLELWHKFKFWFCDDVRLAVPAVSIPNGERLITIQLQSEDNMVFEYPNLYIKKTVSASDSVAKTASRIITYTPVVPSDRKVDTLSIELTELYVNNIFVSNEIHDIYIKRVGFTLIRVFRHQVTNVSQSGQNSVKLEQLKWPMEYLYVGARPAFNQSSSNANQWRDWHRFTYNVDAKYDLKYDIEQVDATSTYDDVFETKSDFVVAPTYSVPLPTMDNITVKSHGINIYDGYNATFFNSYLPYQYGGPVLNTPEDSGVFLINFALFPRSYQPSGHFNLSRARETFIIWNSSYIANNLSCDLVVVGVALNFLLISDGSAILRYST